MNDLKKADLPAGLYLVATPIGNLRDISLRALSVLQDVNIIYCEDTRVTAKLLKAHNISNKTQSYNDHSSDKQRHQMIERITGGEALALVSDAGTPLVSDPGYKLVRDCLDLGISVTTVPGASAVTSALQLSGLPSDKFSFLGFLPPKTVARKKILTEWGNVPSTLVCFETAPRLLAALKDMFEVFDDRQVSVIREITKIYEEVKSGSLSHVISFYEDAGAPKGEIVIVIGPPEQKEWSDYELQAELTDALSTMKVKSAAAFVAEKTGRSKTELYNMALKLNHE